MCKEMSEAKCKVVGKPAEALTTHLIPHLSGKESTHKLWSSERARDDSRCHMLSVAFRKSKKIYVFYSYSYNLFSNMQVCVCVCVYMCLIWCECVCIPLGLKIKSHVFIFKSLFLRDRGRDRV